jgi:molybdopterin-biosynthesis enzyme MoeA-like protein
MSENLESVSGFGLIIIGNEILDGRVDDCHFLVARDLLAQRHLAFRFTKILPDDPDLITAQLQWAMDQSEPFFCCGGIGGTPDDYTRACAAQAAGVSIERHVEGEAILREKFGDDAGEPRLRMIDFPAGATLIPNPVNRVPGFRIRNGHFVPGFPNMASAMMTWVLDHWYAPGPKRTARTVIIPGAREADLTTLMEAFVADHPGLSFSSLPRDTADGPQLRLGLAGPPDAVRAGWLSLSAMLTEAGHLYDDLG